jgi:photosystem II stability/assembly factor-like uncharacterized protein
LFDSLERLAPAMTTAELDDGLTAVLRRSRALRVRRTRRRIGTGGLAVVIVLALVAVVIGVDRPARSVAATSWQLVSEVNPSWQQLPSIGYASGVGLECPTSTDCYAIDTTAQQLEATHDGGLTWQRVALPDGLTTLSSPACPTSSACLLIGTDAAGNLVLVSTSDGGATWATYPTGLRPVDGAAVRSHGSPDAYRYVPALACTTATTCVAVITVLDASSAPASMVIVTHDGGTSWSTSTLPAGFDLLGASCGAQSCVLAGTDMGSSPVAVAYVSTDDEVDWHPATLPAGVGPLMSVSCTTSSCYSIASSEAPDDTAPIVLISTDNGTSWQVTDTSGLPSSVLTDVSCADPSTCWASGVRVTNDGNQATTVAESPGLLATTADGGGSWHSAPLPDGIHAVAQVSCPTSTTCFALAFHVTSDNLGAFVLLARHGTNSGQVPVARSGADNAPL